MILFLTSIYHAVRGEPMEKYSSSKSYDAVSLKNPAESEMRSEIVDSVHISSQNIDIKSIHNKRKLSR